MFRLLDNEPALILKTKDENILLLSDLHIGYEKTLADKGVRIPSLTPRLYVNIEKIVTKYYPDRIILLGDIKHGTSKILAHEWRDVPEFFEKLLLLRKKIEVVPGNHDGGLKQLLPRSITLHTTRGITINIGNKIKALITHGHTWPKPASLDSDLIIMGHNHFTVEFNEDSGLRVNQPVWVVAKWEPTMIMAAYLRWMKIKYRGSPTLKFREHFKTEIGDPTIMIMPAFNSMLSGMVINKMLKAKYISPILASGGVDVNRAEVYLLDHTYLGRSSEMRLSAIS